MKTTAAFVWIILLVLDPTDAENGGNYTELQNWTLDKEMKIRASKTGCNVKCGLGSMVETRCYLRRDEESGTERLEECEHIAVECYAGWECAVQYYNLEIGASTQLDCQTAPLVRHSEQSVSYSWRFAQFLITADDEDFHSYDNGERTIKLYNIREGSTGTYWCRMADSFGKLIKSIYFAVRVVDPSIFDLKDKRLLLKERLKQRKDATRKLEERLERLTLKQQVYVILGVGVGGSVPLGIAVCVVFHCMRRKWEREGFLSI